MPKRETTRNVKTVSYRLPIHLYNRISDYATEHGTTQTEAVVHFLEQGIKAEGGEQAATSAELELLKVQMVEGFKQVAKAIESQPIALQEAQTESQPKQLESAEEKSRWQRLREAWKG